VATRLGPPTKDFPAGTQFGDLTVIQKVRTAPNSPGGQRYRLQCICGQRITKPRFYLVRKQNPLKHCGCQAIKADDPYTKSSYYAMHSRCYYAKHVSYKEYGGRGIKVCWRWHKDNPEGWANFKADMGSRPKGKSLDRFPDVNGNYEPGNCRWATASQQTLNQRHRQ
jgi:hypothetical protein